MPGQLLKRIWESDPHRHAPPRHRRACGYSAFVPDPLATLAPDLPARVAGVVSDAELAVRDLNAAASPALAPLAMLLLRTESIASSKVEGMQLGVRELARAELTLATGGRASQTARDILANITAMQTAITEAATVPRVGAAEVLAIHRRLMERDVNRRNAGSFRTSQNWIGGNDFTPCGADFVPPPPDHLVPLLDDLYDAINDDLLPPLVQAALVHAQFETIHPFDDGNGRTGRALVHVIFKRRGVATTFVPPVSVVLAAGRDRYIAGLTGFRGDRVVEWIEHFAAATARAARLASRYLALVEELTASWRERLRAHANPRADAAAWELINALPAHPLLSAHTASQLTERSRGPLYAAIAQLEEAGVLIRTRSSPRKQVWEAAGLLELIEMMSDGDL